MEDIGEFGGRTLREFACEGRGSTSMLIRPPDFMELVLQTTIAWPNQGAAANRRPAGQSDGSDNLSAIVTADRAFPAAVAELGR
jgi:hypothetical protein